MEIIFQIKDKNGRLIHLSKERWSHIRKKHPEIEDSETLKEAILTPDRIKDYEFDDSVKYFYKYIKNKKDNAKYLLAIVKYLNGNGFIITAYFESYIK